MKLSADDLIRELGTKDDLHQARDAARELRRLLRDRGIAITPLVLVRLQEFIMLCQQVRSLEARIVEEGVVVEDGEKKAKRVHPMLETSFKVRDRLLKSVKEIETMVAAHAAQGPTSLAEFLEPFAEKFRKEKAQAQERAKAGKTDTHDEGFQQHGL